MQSSTETYSTKKVTLVLTEDEARWLHDQMQNPLHDHGLASEPLEDASMRMKFFNATR
jgi:hypothetical protein